jgi:hypothetical protein
MLKFWSYAVALSANFTGAMAANADVSQPHVNTVADALKVIDNAVQVQVKALSDCVVMKTTGQDRLIVVKWLFAGLASAPQVAEVATITSVQKEERDRAMAGLLTRLMVTDCVTESRPLFLTHNSAGFRTVGETLGRIAMQELMGNENTAAAMQSYTKYLNPEDFKKVDQ